MKKNFTKTGSTFLNSLGTILELDNNCSIEQLASLTKISIAYVNCYYIGSIYHDILKANIEVETNEKISEKKLEKLCSEKYSSIKMFLNVKKLNPNLFLKSTEKTLEKLIANFSNHSNNVYFPDDFLNCNLKKMDAQSATNAQKKKFSNLKKYNNYYEALLYCKSYYSLKSLGIEEYLENKKISTT